MRIRHSLSRRTRFGSRVHATTDKFSKAGMGRERNDMASEPNLPYMTLAMSTCPFRALGKASVMGLASQMSAYKLANLFQAVSPE